MGKVSWMYPVADVCGKIDKSSKIVFAHRGNTKYTRMQGVRSTAASATELAQREKFKSVVASTRQRLQDPLRMGADQEAFAAQTKYKTLYQYVFNQEWQA